MAAGGGAPREGAVPSVLAEDTGAKIGVVVGTGAKIGVVVAHVLL